MAIRGEVLDALLAAGATAEQIVAAVKADAAVEAMRLAEKREKDAERQRKSRSKRRSCNVTVTPRDSCDAPNDNISIPQKNLDCSNEQSPPLPVRVVEAWQNGPAKAGARASRQLDTIRKRQLSDRVRDFGEAAVFEAIANAAASPFHCGANERGWRISIGWLLESKKNFLKILELAPSADSSKAPVDLGRQRASDEKTAEIYERMGRTEEAAEIRRRWKPVQVGDAISQIVRHH